MNHTGIVLGILMFALSLATSTVSAQQYSSSPELVVLPGGVGNDTIDVSGIGAYINFTFGLVEVCVSLEIDDAVACDGLMIPNQVFLELHGPDPGINWTLAETFSFPNEVDEMVNTCFTWCPSFDDVNSTSDVSPYTSIYDAHEAFYYADSTEGDGDWSLSVNALCSFDTLVLHDWNLTFGPLVPIPGAPVIVDPSCPGDADGEVHIVTAQNGYCFPQEYAIDGIGYTTDSVITGLSANPSFNVWAIDARGAGIGSGPHSLSDDDVEDPVILSPPSDTTLYTSDGSGCSVAMQVILPDATDNCDDSLGMWINYSFPYDQVAGGVLDTPGAVYNFNFPRGLNEISFQAVDQSGNASDVYTQYVWVVDDEDPMIMCNDFPAPVDNDAGLCTAYLTKMVPQPTDNCNPSNCCGAPPNIWMVNVQISYADGGYEEFNEEAGMTYDRDFPIGTSTIFYSYTDAGDNNASCSEPVLVVDNELPVMSCPPDVTIGTSTSSDICAGEIYIIHPSVSDNCDVETLLLTYEGPGGLVTDVMVSPDAEMPLVLLEGVTTIDYEVIDEFGNSEFCGYNIEVVDDTPPDWDGPLPSMLVGECPDDDIEGLLDANLPGTSDDCQSSTYEIVSDVIVGSCGSTTDGTVGLILIDGQGNESVDTFYIDYLIDDTTPPVLNSVPNSDLEVDCSESLPSTPFVTASDACDNSVIPELTIETIITECDPDIVAMYVYTWVATDDCGNSSSASWTVSVTNGPSVQITDENGDDVPSLLCVGLSLTIEAQTVLPDAIYAWSTGESTPAITISGAGIYGVTVTSPGGCCASDEVEIIEGSDVEAMINQIGELSCGGDPITLEALSTPAAVAYLWSTNDDTPTIPVSSAGTYMVTVTTIDDCIASASISVPNAEAPQNIVIEGGDLSCLQPTVTLMGSSSTPDVVFSWRMLPDGESMSGSNYEVSEAGDYELTVTGSNACSAIAITTVGGTTSIADIDYTVNTITCTDSEVQIQLLNTDPGSVFMWNGPGLVSDDTVQDPWVNMPGMYQVVVTDLNSCTAEIQVIVEADTTLPTAIATADPDVTITCTNPIIKLEGFAGGMSGVWTDDFGGVIGIGNIIEVDTPGIYTFTVLNGVNGCEAMDFIEIDEDRDDPAITDSIVHIDCDKDVAFLMVNTIPLDVSYLWSGPDGFSSDEPSPEAVNSGMYTVTVTDNINGCTTTKSLELDKDVIQVDIQISTREATNGFNGVAWYELFEGVEPIDVSWYDGEVDTLFGFGDTISQVPAGLHYILVEDGNGCIDVINWIMGNIPTLCDHSATPLSTETLIIDSLSNVRLAPQSFVQQMCVEEIFGSPVTDSIFLRSYLYQTSGEVVNLEYAAGDIMTSRAFIFTCEQFQHFNKDSCLDYTPASNPGTIELEPSEPFYYIVIAGLKGSAYSLIIHSQDTLTICESGEDILECGAGPVSDMLSGEDRFNFVNQESSVYGQCYRGDRLYTGPEKVYELNTELPSMAVFKFAANTDMGVFIYDYQCTKRCVSYFETNASSSTVIDTILLNAGNYFIVVDQSVEEPDKSFSIEVECIDLEDYPWPDRRIAECYDTDTTTSHDITFSSTSLHFGPDVIGPDDKLILYLLNPDGDQKVGPGIRIPKNSLFNVKAFSDILGDSSICGYREEENIVFRLKRAGKAESLFCTPRYTEDSWDGFERGAYSTIDSFYQTEDIPSYVSDIRPFEFADIPYDSTTVSFTVEANQSWHLEMPEKKWILGTSIPNGVDSLRGLGGSSVTINLKRNDSIELRTATVRVVFDDSKEFLRFKITQHGDETMTSTTLVRSDYVFDVFPNPNSGEFVIDYDFGYWTDFNLTVVDILGKVIVQQNALKGEKGTHHVDMGAIPNGIYFVQVVQGGNKQVRKIVVQD